MRAETLLNGLYKVIKNQDESPEKRARAGGFIRWYLKNQMFTGKQREYIKLIIGWETKPVKEKRAHKPTKYFLYAISDGDAIQIGLTKSVAKQLIVIAKESTLAPVTVWSRYAGKEVKTADKRLRQLLRWCEPWHDGGNWHKLDAVERIEEFKIK